jgi:hypothetical protein
MKTSLIATLLIAALGALPAADGHAHNHGEAKEIGSLTIGARTAVVKADGAIVAGGHLLVEIELSPATPAPNAVRIWVGAENGRGSVKAKANPVAGEPGAYSTHLEVPNPLPAGSQVWVALEGATTEKAGLAIKP